MFNFYRLAVTVCGKHIINQIKIEILGLWSKL